MQLVNHNGNDTFTGILIKLKLIQVQKLLIVGITLIFLFGCKQNKEEKITNTIERQAERLRQTRFYIGTYTDKDSRGIYSYSLLNDGSLQKNKLLAETENPSFLTFSKDRQYVLAVNENEKGTVESYKIKNDTLLFVNRSLSGGAHPCFITTTNNNYVLTANYTGGNTGLLKLQNDGSLSELLTIHQHEGKMLDHRQDGPHAHSVWTAPGKKDIIEVDLGTNELLFSVIDEKKDSIIPKSPARLKMNPGDGPRHMAFHPNGKWAYVINELSNTINILSEDEKENWKLVSSVSTLPEGYTLESYCADIHISSDGKFVYASNRGHNSIAIFKVEENGSLENVGFESVRGDWPRNFSLSPDEEFLLVANQRSNSIVSFKRDKTSGLLTYVEITEAPSPVCILFE